MNQYELAVVLESASYRFAKTMPKNPHHYSHIDTWDDRQLFADVVSAIRLYGSPESFYGKTYIQFYANGFFYWSMGAPANETTIINRKSFALEGAGGFYDSCDDYDAWYSSPEALAENDEVQELLRPVVDSNSPIIDIGAGTGLFLDLFPEAADRYIGVDPSSGMLKNAAAKHPSARWVCARAEDLWWPNDQRATIVSLFGSPSYVAPRTWDRWSSNPLFLMFYANGYSPKFVDDHGYNDLVTFTCDLSILPDILFGKYELYQR